MTFTPKVYKEWKDENQVALKTLYDWAEGLLGRVLKGKLQKAVHYLINQKKYLTVFLQNPNIEISNNRVERAIRPFTLGRKNWQFSITANGANTSAVIYSLIETAKLNYLNPSKYLEFILTEMTSINPPDIEELMPWKYKAQKAARLPQKAIDNIRKERQYRDNKNAIAYEV